MFNELSYIFNVSSKIKNPYKTKNYVDASITNIDNSSKNPYLILLEKFEKHQSLYINPKQLAYLKDLGNKPINRMIILRRFGNDVIPAINLINTKSAPISTVIGWVKEDDSFPTIGFNEEWDTINQRLDTLLVEMVQKEFGVKLDMLSPVPGWAQGFLYNFYSKMGITDLDANKLPFGNPNVLHESKTRNSGIEAKMGLKSDISLDFEVEYEQKIIADLDPGLQMLEIIRNLATMGTSDTVFYMTTENAKGNTQIKALRDAINGNTLNAWVNFTTTVIDAFTDAISATLKSAVSTLTDIAKDVTSGDSGSIATTLKQVVADPIIASTVGKYRWVLKGSIGLMTGTPTTPWHLTIGHPFNPYLSCNNILVERIDIIPSNELGFNDFPKSIKAKIRCSVSRSMGKQEILQTLGQKYIRTYNDLKNKKTVDKLDQITPIDSFKSPTIASSNNIQPTVIGNSSIKTDDKAYNSTLYGKEHPDQQYIMGEQGFKIYNPYFNEPND